MVGDNGGGSGCGRCLNDWLAGNPQCHMPIRAVIELNRWMEVKVPHRALVPTGNAVRYEEAMQTEYNASMVNGLARQPGVTVMPSLDKELPVTRCANLNIMHSSPMGHPESTPDLT